MLPSRENPSKNRPFIALKSPDITKHTRSEGRVGGG
jgi:hypothetical protein